METSVWTYVAVAASIAGLTLARLLVMAGIPWLIAYVWKPAFLHRYKLNPAYPSGRTVWAEVKLDLVNIIHFVLYGTLAYYFYSQGRTRVYTDPAEYGLLYLPLSMILLMVIQDAYFYWTHRLFHLPAFAFIGHATH